MKEMARGYVFGVSANREWIRSCSFAGSLDSMYGYEFKSLDKRNSPKAIEDLMTALSLAGAETGKRNVHDALYFYELEEDEEKLYWFKLTDDVKSNWFQRQFNKTKTSIAAMTLDQFAADGLHSHHRLADDLDSDAVYGNISGFQTLDSFIRNAECGKTYYVKTAYLMR